MLSAATVEGAKQRKGGSGAAGNDSGISSPIGPTTGEEARSEIYRFEVSDFLLLNLSAYQLAQCQEYA